MATRTATLIARLVDDVSGPAKKMGDALKHAEAQAKALSKAQALGASSRFTSGLQRFGAQAADIDKATSAWKKYAASIGLAADRSSWTKAQVAQIRQWESSTVAALGRVQKAEQALAKVPARAAAVAAAGRQPGRRFGGVGPALAEKAEGIGARALAPAIVAAGATKAFTTFADDERKLTRIGITADGTRKQMEAMRVEAFKLATMTAQPFGKIVEGMDVLAAQGRTLSEIKDLLPAVARTAQASGSEVGDIARTADSVASNMKISAGEMQTAFDEMVTAGQKGQFELKDMAQYLPSMLPAARALGMEGTKGLADIAAMLQIIRKGTGTSEEAASSMQNIFAKMESEETSKRFKKFGIDLRAEMTKARKEGKNLLQVFEDLSYKAVKGDISKVPQLFSDMEFARGMRALLSMRGAWQKMSADIQRDAPGTTDRNLARVLDDAQARLDRLKTSAHRTADELGKLLAIPAVPFLDKMNDALTRLRESVEENAKPETIKRRLEENRNAEVGRRAKAEEEQYQERVGEYDRQIAEEKGKAQRVSGARGPMAADVQRRIQAKIDELERQKRDLQDAWQKKIDANIALGGVEKQIADRNRLRFLQPNSLNPRGINFEGGYQRFGFGPGGSPGGYTNVANPPPNDEPSSSDTPSRPPPRLGVRPAPGKPAPEIAPPGMTLEQILGVGKVKAEITGPVKVEGPSPAGSPPQQIDVAPHADDGHLKNLSAAAEETKTKLAEVSGVHVTPTVDVSQIRAARVEAEGLLATLAKIPGAVGAAKSAAANIGSISTGKVAAARAGAMSDWS